MSLRDAEINLRRNLGGLSLAGSCATTSVTRGLLPTDLVHEVRVPWVFRDGEPDIDASREALVVAAMAKMREVM